VVVDVNPTPAMSTISGATTLCTTTSTTLSTTGTGGVWSSSDTTVANITSGGVYWVTTTNSFGCSSTSQPFYSSLGVKGGVSSSPQLYPNPGVSPTLDLGTWDKAEVVIWDAQGKVVYRKKMAAGTMVLPELFAGIYSIEVRSNNVIWKQKWINP
jgi:hypothetical protein